MNNKSFSDGQDYYRNPLEFNNSTIERAKEQRQPVNNIPEFERTLGGSRELRSSCYFIVCSCVLVILFAIVCILFVFFVLIHIVILSYSYSYSYSVLCF